jgi:hypothetical protein
VDEPLLGYYWQWTLMNIFVGYANNKKPMGRKKTYR